MADEYVDIIMVEELSVFCCWVEEGLPVKHFLEIVHLQKADSESIYSKPPLFFLTILRMDDLPESRDLGFFKPEIPELETLMRMSQKHNFGSSSTVILIPIKYVNTA